MTSSGLPVGRGTGNRTVWTSSPSIHHRSPPAYWTSPLLLIALALTGGIAA